MCFKFAQLAHILIQVVKIRYFNPLEVVGRGSETQLQVGENLNFILFPRNGLQYL